ncbi:radical SAM protein [Candidatus Micrarchaeota archaeon]|nr:radical SAM protein [Candidatus Micrarchaeota archaeon]
MATQPPATAVKNTATVIPSLRVAVSPACNFNCVYCPPNKGEHRDLSTRLRRQWDSKRMAQITRVYSKLGAPSIRVTGGEPLHPAAFARVPPLVEAAADAGVEVRVNTNGYYVEENLSTLVAMRGQATAGFMLSVSLDATDAREFALLTQSSEDAFDKVVRGARKARDAGIPVLINMVLIDLDKPDRLARDPHIMLPRVIDKMLKMAEFCIAEGFDLKILDLNWYSQPGKMFWESNYSSATLALEEFLKAVEDERIPAHVQSKIVREPGNYGIPMPTFWFESARGKRVSVTFKDSELGTTYSYYCYSCSLIPKTGLIHAEMCQEGLYQSVLTSNQIITACRHKQSELATDLIHQRTDADIKGALRSFLTCFTLGFFQPVKNMAHELRFPRTWKMLEQFHAEVASTPQTKLVVVNEELGRRNRKKRR